MKKILVFLAAVLLLWSGPAFAVSINVDQIIWQPDITLDPSSLSATVELTADDSDMDSFTITLTNTSTLSTPDDFPATVLLTGIGFNLPSELYITGGNISGDLRNSTIDPGLRWGYDNNPLDAGPFQQGEATTKSISTVVSTMESATEFDASLVDGDAEFKGPDYGVLSTAYAGVSIPNKPYFLGSVEITINLQQSITGTWESFFSSIDSQDVVVSFGSPTSPTQPIPEPATMMLLGTGLIGIAGLGRKKFKK